MTSPVRNDAITALDAPGTDTRGTRVTPRWLTKFLQPWIKLLTSLWPDVKSLTSWEATFLVAFMCVSILFSFLDINFYLYPDTRPTPNKVQNDEEWGVPGNKRVFMQLSGAASFTGAVSVVFASKGKYSNYSFGIVNATLYGLFAWAYGYAGDAQLNVLFFNAMQVVGMYTWTGSLNSEDTAVVRSLKWWGWAVSIGAAVALAAAFYWEIPAFAEAIDGVYFYPGVTSPHVLDACTNSLSIVAQTLLLLRFWEQWIFWVIIDCMQISMFAGINGFGVDANVLIMWSFFLVNACFGLTAWFIRWRRQRNPTIVPDILVKVAV